MKISNEWKIVETNQEMQLCRQGYVEMYTFDLMTALQHVKLRTLDIDGIYREDTKGNRTAIDWNGQEILGNIEVA